MDTNYQLSAYLPEHNVIGMCVCGDSGIATSSTDRRIRYWTLFVSNQRDYKLAKTLSPHFAYKLAWIAPNDTFPQGGIVSVGDDYIVFVWDLATGKRTHTLKHSVPPTGVVVDGSEIVSFSAYAGNIMRWREDQLVESWPAHRENIKVVIILASRELLSGSRDHQVRRWSGRDCVSAYSHRGPVVSLVELPGVGFFSASEDCKTRDCDDRNTSCTGSSISLWELSGELLLEVEKGHIMFRKIDALFPWSMITCGSYLDDCALEKWSFRANTYPSRGCTKCQVFRGKRFRTPRLEDLPGVEALQIRGDNDDEIRVVREGGHGIVYMWKLNTRKATDFGPFYLDGEISANEDRWIQCFCCHKEKLGFIKSNCGHRWCIDCQKTMLMAHDERFKCPNHSFQNRRIGDFTILIYEIDSKSHKIVFCYKVVVESYRII